MLKILIVEDEAIAAMFLRATLERLGHSVIGTTDTGETAIARAQRDRPDLVLMDTRLRSEMSGVEAANRIRAELSIPCIFVSASEEQHLADSYDFADEFQLIAKPVADTELNAALQRLELRSL